MLYILTYLVLYIIIISMNETTPSTIESANLPGSKILLVSAFVLTTVTGLFSITADDAEQQHVTRDTLTTVYQYADTNIGFVTED